MAVCSMFCAEALPGVINLVAPELLSVRRVAQQIGQLWNKPVCFVDEEPDTCLFNSGQRCHRWVAQCVGFAADGFWTAEERDAL